MLKYQRLTIGLSALCLFAIYWTVPVHKANLSYVRGATAMALMHELGNLHAPLTIAAQQADRPDLMLVSASAVEISSSELAGLRTDRKTTYKFSVRTRSYCFELEPGCLKIDQKQVSKAVSVKVPM
jgi:hypothetical protein